MRASSSLFTVASALAAVVVHASTLTPPVLPLIVRNPYLSTWLGNARDVPWEKWPMFWTGQEVREALISHVKLADILLPRLDSACLHLLLKRIRYILC
jgi:hypothetical protein